MVKEAFLKKLGGQIVKLRSDRQWSQSELARACGKDRQSIERLEKGKINPSIYYLKEVADALEISISRLCDFS